jgi:CRISPR-associated protein Csb2
MLTIEIELLGGRYVATEHNDRSRAEWPPHPARFYSAMVAALHDHEPVDPAERSALVWLEQQAAPQLDVDLDVDERVGRREVRSVFVPVNDVTLVGDPEAAVREARERLAAAERGGDGGTSATEIRRARKELVRQEAKLTAFIATQQVTDAEPAGSTIETAGALLPERRVRQERTFPTIVPGRPTFAFIWPDSRPAEHLTALRRLSDRVTRLGHSSSLVRCTIVERALAPTLVPQSAGEYVLRVVGPGQLDRLEDAYARHQAVDARILPARPQRYGVPETHEENVPRSVFSGDWIVLERSGGDRPLASRSVDVATALRRALLEVHGARSLPPVLSGHAATGERGREPHLAFASLPWVGHPHADGAIQGMALIPPRTIVPNDLEMLNRLLARWEAERGDPSDDYALELGTSPDVMRPLRVRFRRVEVPTKTALSVRRWSAPARRFITATPIALDRHPGRLRSNVDRGAHKAAGEAQRSIADACERIGLPRPVRVSISLAPLIPGAQHVREYAPWPSQPGRPRRARVHADITFADRVRGPVILGAGRHVGLGLCLPVPDGNSAVTKQRAP